LQTSFFVARHWIYNLQIYIFVADCCIVWHTMFHCLQIYIFVTDNRQFQYFTFLPHDVEILVKFTFFPLRWLLHWLCIYITVSIFFVYLHFCHTMLNFLWNLHFCRWLLHWLCIYIFAVTLAVAVALFVHLHFCRLFCIAYKFRFLPLAVALHFAACSCIAYVFFCFANLHFCRLLVHCLSIYILSHTIVLCWNKRSIILPRPQGNNNNIVVGFILHKKYAI